MNRRGFLKSLFVGAGAVAAAPLLKFLPAAPPIRPALSDPIPIRFVKHFGGTARVNRFDVIYAMGAVRPDLTCRVSA